MIPPLTKLNILLIEDNIPDFLIIKKQLKKLSNIEIKISHALTCREAIAYLKDNLFDVIFLDLSLPDSQNLDTVKTIYAHADDNIPILILTGLDDEEIAIASVKEGAQDYLVKGDINLHNLQRVIRYAIERKHRIKEVKILNQKLINSNQELENYAYIVSHDLKQPLQTILASSQLLLHLEKDNLAENSLTLLNFILESSHGMNKLIDTLLSYAQLTKLDDEKEAINCFDIIDKVLKLLKNQIEKTNAIIHIKTEDNYPSIDILYNPIQLTQVFQNIISNALKYVADNNYPYIIITIEKKPSYWLFKIEDNGIGIKPENHHKIFQMLERIDSEKKYEGLGIGLATCKKIIEANGGKIWVESVINKGSTFFFTIPN